MAPIKGVGPVDVAGGVKGVAAAITGVAGAGIAGGADGFGTEDVVAAIAGVTAVGTGGGVEGFGMEGVVAAMAGTATVGMAGGTEGFGTEGAAATGMAGGVAGFGNEGAVAAGVASVGIGGWKSRADLRSSGSTGGVIALDFLASETGAVPAAGAIEIGGSVTDADLRVSGSTGGTIGADFLATVGSPGREGMTGGPARSGGGVEGVTGGTLAVLLGRIGIVVAACEAVPMTEGFTDVVRRGNATEGGRGAGAEESEEAPGIGGGLAVGARMGDDLATGSGKWGGVAGETSSGGVTVVACDGNEGGLGVEDASGGCGASGSGTRGAGTFPVDCTTGTGGRGVLAVSFKPDEVGGMCTDSRLMLGSVPVEGSAGGRLPCGIGCRSLGASTLPLLTKTLACGLATITRGGAIWPEAVVPGTGPVPERGSAGGAPGGVPTGGVASLAVREGTVPVSGGAGEAKVLLSREVFERGLAPLNGGAAGRGAEGVGSTSGSVLAREVDPVSADDCFKAEEPVGATKPVGGRVAFCIGCVTAVDQAGGMPCDPEGLGVSLFDVRIGMVGAEEPAPGLGAI